MLHSLVAPFVHAGPAEAGGFILSGIKGIFIIIGSIIAAILCAVIGKSKGYSAIVFGVLGLIFSIITLIVAIVIPRRSRV